jgi:methyl-accepting chemotaxis protein
MARRRTIVLGAAVAAAALLAGCGGGDDESSAEQWANGVCSAITDWTDATRSAAESLQSGGEGSVEDRINTAIDDVKDATSTLGDDLQDLGAPETESGDQAQELVQTFSENAQDGLDTIEQAVDGASTVSEALTAVSTVSTTLASLWEQASSTFTDLQDLDAGGELSDAFDRAESCDELRGGGS